MHGVQGKWSHISTLAGEFRLPAEDHSKHSEFWSCADAGIAQKSACRRNGSQFGGGRNHGTRNSGWHRCPSPVALHGPECRLGLGIHVSRPGHRRGFGAPGGRYSLSPKFSMDDPRNYIAEVEAAVRHDPLSVPPGIQIPPFPFTDCADDAAREEVLNVLAAVLDVPNGGTRKTAAFALAQFGDPRPLKLLADRRSKETTRGNIEAINAAITVLRTMPHGVGSSELERRQAVANAYSGEPPQTRPFSDQAGVGTASEEPVPTSLPALAPESSTLEDLIAFQQSIDRLAPTFSKGSLVAKAIVPVNYVLDRLKSLALGVPWKLATKAVPPVATIGDSLASLQQAAERLAGPAQILSRIVPSVVEAVRTSESSGEYTPGLSSQLSTILRTRDPLRQNLQELSRLSSSTRSVITTVSHSMEKLHGIKGIGALADSLNASLTQLDQSLSIADARNMELVSASDRVGKWLPAYYAEVRKVLPSPRACQATVKVSFWKKDMCGSPVEWFDDEAQPVCTRCGIILCGRHRVEVPSALDSVVRCTWLCTEHSHR